MSIAIARKARKRPAKNVVVRHDAGISMTIIGDNDTVQVPSWVQDLASFRAWRDQDDVSEKLRAYFLDGEVWIDMSKVQIFTHVGVKREFTVVLGVLTKIDRRGQFYPDGLYVSNINANLSANPDGTYILLDTLENGRVRLVEGKEGGYVEIEGSPDMVLEIVSKSSVTKDLPKLRELYWKADIPEYWLVDVRGDEVVFEIYRHGAKGYATGRKQDGWIKSNVFGKSFRLVRGQDKFSNPEFTLEVK